MENIAKNVIRMPGDVHVNALLTNVSVAYIQSASNFIADRVFPVVTVGKQSDIFARYSRADWNRDEMEQRAPATESAGAGFGTDEDTYFARVWSLHHDIADATRGNADPVFKLDSDATNFLTMKALIRKERSWVSKFFVPGVWGINLTGVAAAPAGGQFLQWHLAASTPIEDVRAQKRAVLEKTGFEPNKLVLGKATYDALIDHPDIVDRVKYGQTPNGAALVNMQALAALFELDEILVSKAIVNTAKQGAAEASSFIAGKAALLAYVPATVSTMMPASGVTFAWDGWFGASSGGFRIKKFRMENLEADRVEIQASYDQKMVGADLAVYFASAVA